MSKHKTVEGVVVDRLEKHLKEKYHLALKRAAGDYEQRRELASDILYDAETMLCEVYDQHHALFEELGYETGHDFAVGFEYELVYKLTDWTDIDALLNA